MLRYLSCWLMVCGPASCIVRLHNSVGERTNPPSLIWHLALLRSSVGLGRFQPEIVPLRVIYLSRCRAVNKNLCKRTNIFYPVFRRISGFLRLWRRLSCAISCWSLLISARNPSGFWGVAPAGEESGADWRIVKAEAKGWSTALVQAETDGKVGGSPCARRICSSTCC